MFRNFKNKQSNIIIQKEYLKKFKEKQINKKKQIFRLQIINIITKKKKLE